MGRMPILCIRDAGRAADLSRFSPAPCGEPGRKTSPGYCGIAATSAASCRCVQCGRSGPRHPVCSMPRSAETQCEGVGSLCLRYESAGCWNRLNPTWVLPCTTHCGVLLPTHRSMHACSCVHSATSWRGGPRAGWRFAKTTSRTGPLPLRRPDLMLLPTQCLPTLIRLHSGHGRARCSGGLGRELRTRLPSCGAARPVQAVRSRR